jgi:hypothetical protein
MVDCKPVLTLVDMHAKVSTEFGPPIADMTHFRSPVGALQYLTFTLPDISYAVMKCTLRYLRGTLDYGLLLRCSTSSKLTVYTDVDWAGCPDTHRSTSGYAVFLGTNLIS